MIYIPLPPNPIDAVALFVILIGTFSALRLAAAWWDARSLRRVEEVERMVWRRMR